MTNPRKANIRLYSLSALQRVCSSLFWFYVCAVIGVLVSGQKHQAASLKASWWISCVRYLSSTKMSPGIKLASRFSSVRERRVTQEPVQKTKERGRRTETQLVFFSEQSLLTNSPQWIWHMSVLCFCKLFCCPPPSGHSNQLAAASTTVFKPIPEKQPAVNVATEWQLRDDGSELFPPFPTILLSGKQQSLSPCVFDSLFLNIRYPSVTWLKEKRNTRDTSWRETSIYLLFILTFNA